MNPESDNGFVVLISKSHNFSTVKREEHIELQEIDPQYQCNQTSQRIDLIPFIIYLISFIIIIMIMIDLTNQQSPTQPTTNDNKISKMDVK